MSPQNQEDELLVVGRSASGEFTVDANIVASGRTCVIGSSGSGKSYTVGVLCEELCRTGVPFAVVDTEGEHSGLKEKFEAIWVGTEGGCDLVWDGLDLADLARQAPDISPLILDVSDIGDPKEKIGAFLTSLYETLTERRTPYLVVLEEADKFIPQQGQRLPIFGEVARRGRKRGMGLMICSQRPSLVDKNVLSQCGNQLIGKLIIQNDLQSVAQFFPGRGLPKELTALKSGEFFAMGGFSQSPALVTVRSRTTKHGGTTPTFVRRVVKKYVGPMRQYSPTGTPPSEASQTAPPGKTALGVAAAIALADVPLIVKRGRKFGFLGAQEAVTGVEAHYRTLILLGVRMRRGLLRKRLETVYLTLDGSTGKEVSIDRELEVKRGFEKLVGLSTLQVEVLREVSPGADTSAVDVASSLGESRSTVSRVLSQLSEKRLVRTVEVRRKKLFRRLVDLPEEPSEVTQPELAQVDLQKAKVVPPRIREQDLREVVKGLWDGADVESFQTLLYPVFKVDLVLKRRHRQVFLDGRSGKELEV
ncbi:MAG: DUF87 domain-containing protein [Thaumarchaeota archaeon]|nr:DUF87 domain-containing protein [Nitrososphaerota archaeon]